VLQQLLARTVRSTEPWESLGGRATIEFYEKSGLMIVSQTADGHRRLSDLLDSLRRERAIMVSIEARFITVADSFLNDVTFDFDVAFLNKGSRGWRGDVDTTIDPSQIPTGNAFPTLPGLTGFPANPLDQVIILNSTSSNAAGVSNLMPGLQAMGAPFANFLANEGGMALSGVYLDDIQVGFLIRAIQADVRSTTLFAPRLTLWNGQRAWLADGTRFGYIGDLEPVVAEAAVAWDPTIEYITAGSLLDVKATVSADRRYVHLDLRPQVTQTPAFRVIVIQAATPAGGIATAQLEVPTVRITEMQTSVSVPDGGTLLIGGLKMFEEHDVEAGVPIFSKIPALKRLFTNRGLQRGHQNMLILVKPTIIIQSEEEAKIGTDEWDI
jgi:general secretion pathway protein D